MGAYFPLLERTQLPQPSFQRFAVTQIFEKLRTAPANLGPESDPGREAITRCLSAFSTPAVVDQSVCELCKLVAQDLNLGVARGLLELQSAIEGSEPRYVDLFVKGIGFLVRFGFRSRSTGWKFETTERHPFVKVLLCRNEVQTELIRQVSLFVVQSKQYGMNEVCDYLRPLLEFSVLRIPFSDSNSVSFAWLLLSSLASLCCSLASAAIPMFKLLTSCLKYFPSRSEEDLKNLFNLAEIIVDAHIVVLRDLVKMELMVQEAQISGVMLVDALLSICSDFEKPNSMKEPLVELSGRLLGAQKELGLPYLPQLSSSMFALFVILHRLEFEHEQLCVLHLFSFLFDWRTGDGYIGAGVQQNLSETLIFILPIINFMSSTSSSVRGAAMNSLLTLEKVPFKFLATASTGQSIECRSSFVSSPQIILFRLLEFIWLQESRFFVRIASTNSTASDAGQLVNEPKSWTCLVEEFALSTAEKQNMSFSSTSSHDSLLPGMAMMMGALTGVLLLHPTLGSPAIDTFIAVAKMEPKLGVTLLQAVLYYTNFLRDKCLRFSDLLLKLLGLLSSLVSHSAMVPLVVQTLMPMLRNNTDSVVYATAVRLLCKAWEINDRIFGTLQSVLLPEKFEEFAHDRSICISMAASICDICRRNPDRGVDLILSVAASIECHDPAIQAIGFQSLSHLCEADVVDFYTAWIVISKHILDYTSDAMIAQSLCSLLRWGAVDVEAYTEAAENILEILWDIGKPRDAAVEHAWAKARGSSFEALSHFDVLQIEKSIENFKAEIFNYLIAETNMDVLRALEKIEDNIIANEHKARRRSVKEKTVSASKIEKMLDVFPRVVFHAGQLSYTQEFPGASLICLPFKEKGLHHKSLLKVSKELLAWYDDTSKEIAASLHLSRNILIALIVVESWKPFMQQWLRANITFLNSKTSSIFLDKTSKAAGDILKKLIQVAEDAIPRTAENVALAVGALCAILPHSVHAVKATALEFLDKWLHQSEHEHRQWSAAISIGLISTSIHVTDHRKKLEHIDGLIQVACSSKSSIVKGACGVGLGFACQSLLCRTGSTLEEEPSNNVELNLLGKIIRLLSSMIAQLTQSSSDLLLNLCQYIPPGSEGNSIDVTNELMLGSSDEPDEEIWGVAGMIVGLGGTLSALYRAGSYDTIRAIKSLFMSWITCASAQDVISEHCHILLSMGACLGLPDVVFFCRKVDLMHDSELDQLIISYKQLISKLLLSKMSISLHGSLLTVACVGAGNLLACILGEGMHPLEVECVKELLELFRKTYSGTYSHVTHFGGMLGTVNAMGAGAGTLFNHHHLKTPLHAVNERKGSSKIMGGLLNSSLEPYITSLMQDIFLVAQSCEDYQLQQYAAWAMSLLRYHLQYKELRICSDSQQNNVSMHKQPTPSLPEDSAVMKLSLWLLHSNSSETDSISYANLLVLLRCLSRAPRLPSLDWVVVVRRCIRYGAQISAGSVGEKDQIEEDCLQFLLVHADKFDSLLSYLDELYYLPKFRTLDLNLQSFLLSHLSDVLRLFSGDRLKMLLNDIIEYLSASGSSYQSYTSDDKSLLRVSCWKGLCQCLDSEFLIDTEKYFHAMEHCMEVLFFGLPRLSSALLLGGASACLAEEWAASIKCLGKARPTWLQDLLWVQDVHLEQKGQEIFLSAVKKIQAKVHLVRQGFLPPTELGKLKVSILNAKFEGLWDVLVDFTAALQHAEGSARRQWLLDVLEISCITKHPSTALQFLALLSGSFCRYMPFLILDQRELLRDLPVTLSSLLSSSRWDNIAESAVSYLWTSTERVYAWVVQSVEQPPGSSHLIEESEREFCADSLLHVMLHTCISLRHHLSLEKQLNLANMVSTFAMH